MPGRFRLALEADRDLPRDRIPLGPPVQAAFLKLVEIADPALSSELHDGHHRPLYHCAALPQDQGRMILCGGFLRDGDLERALAGWLRRMPEEVRIGPAAFRVARLLGADDAERETGSVPLAALGLDVGDFTGVQIHFRTPTLFRAPSQGMHGPRPVRAWPSPERVLDNLVRRLALAETEAGQPPTPVERAADLALYLSEHDGEGAIRGWQAGERSVRGFVGAASWTLDRACPLESRRLLARTLALAPYVGVGSRTTHGCGDVSLHWRKDR